MAVTRPRIAVSAFAALAALLALLVLATPARADRPVIERGREAEVVALFAPHPLGGEVVAGWRLMWIRVEVARIDVELEGPESAKAGLVLEHPDHARPGAERSASFAVSRAPPDPPPAGREAVDRLISALAHNDHGGFWRAEDQEGHSGGTGLPGHGGPLPGVRAWLTDGTVLSALVIAALFAIVVRLLRDTSWSIRGVLALVVVAGGVLRWTIAPEVALGAWPYSRLVVVYRRIFHGPALAAAASVLGARPYLTDVVFAANFLFATLTPLAVFAHMRSLTRDARVAVAAAALLAVLPNHIRFSRSEVEFIPSLLLSSLTFAILHVALAERSRAVRWVASVALPLVLVAAVAIRELNALLVPLAVAGALWLAPDDVPRSRRAVLAAVVAVAGAGAVVGIVLRDFPSQVREGLSLATLATALGSVVSLHDTLINPWITPLGLTVLAGAGAVQGWRAGGAERRKAGFLLAWLGLFYLAHAYVTPKEVAMQARYHLHLAPPFVMLAAPALVALYDRRVWVGRAMVGYAAAAPLLHLSFERDVGFNDVREFAFARVARDRIPDGCTVLEYTGEGTGDRDARFGRIGERLDSSGPAPRFRSVPAGARLDAPGADPLRPEARAVLRALPECAMLYQGIPCFSEKPREAPVAAACATLETELRLEKVAETRFPSRPYDENLAKGFGDLREVPLVLYRVLGAKAPEALAPPERRR